MSDNLDNVLAAVGSFDWITPTLGWLRGYNKGVLVESFDQAHCVKVELSKQGIKAHIEGDIFNGYKVMWKE